MFFVYIHVTKLSSSIWITFFPVGKSVLPWSFLGGGVATMQWFDFYTNNQISEVLADSGLTATFVQVIS